MAYNIYKDPNIVTDFGDWTFKRKDWQTVDKNWKVVSKTTKQVLNKSVSPTSTPNTWSVSSILWQIPWTTKPKLDLTVKWLLDKSKPQNNVYTESSPASMPVKQIMQPIVSKQDTWISIIPKAQASETDIIKSFYDNPQIPDEDKQKISDAIWQWMNRQDAEDYLVTKYSKRDLIIPNQEWPWFLDKVWQLAEEHWQKALDTQSNPNLSWLTKILTTPKEWLKFLWDVAIEWVKEITPDSIKNLLTDTAKNVWAQTPEHEKQALINWIKKWWRALENFKKNYPNTAEIIDTWLTIWWSAGTARTVIKWSNLIKKWVENTISTAWDVLKNVKVWENPALQNLSNKAAEQLLASDWKLNKKTRWELNAKVWESWPWFALKNNLVWKDVEDTINNTEAFKLQKIQEKIDAVKNFGDTETPAVAKRMANTMWNKILTDTKSSYWIKNDAEAIKILKEEHPEFWQVYDLSQEIWNSNKISYTNLEKLKELYDHLNPENIEFDVTGKPKNEVANRLAFEKRAKLQKILEDAWLEKWIDIKWVNKDIMWAHSLARWLNDTVLRKENLNLLWLWDTQMAILSWILWWAPWAVWWVLLRKWLNSESLKWAIAKKLYNPIKNEISNIPDSNMTNPTSKPRLDMIMNNNSNDTTTKVKSLKKSK